MSMRNPTCEVKISVSNTQANDWYELLDILCIAGIIKPTFNTTLGTFVSEFVLYPPKHVVNNRLWAERVQKYCTARSIPAMIVRS